MINDHPSPSIEELLARIQDLQAQLEVANAKIADLNQQLEAWGQGFQYGAIER